jgi:putative oxidoreductase
MNFVDNTLRTYGAMVGRMLIGFLFVYSGASILSNGIEGFAGMIEMRDLPLPMLLAWAVVAIKIVGGACLILGYRTQQAALALMVFVLLTVLLYHLDWQDMNLGKNLAIMGGLMYVYVYGPGNGWRLRV